MLRYLNIELLPHRSLKLGSKSNYLNIDHLLPLQSSEYGYSKSI